MEFELIVRGNECEVQLNVAKFPLFCPSCRNYMTEIYEHNGSRYGQVGSIKCDCGETLNLTDSDNIIEYINIQVRKLKAVVDFKKLFLMEKKDFEKLKNDIGYNIYEKHFNEKIDLNYLILNIENYLGEKISPFETEFPATIGIKKWIGLMKKITKAQHDK
ncbi:hypothetical protein [Frigoriflavimonas asaccharolytica]|uniref:Uncharacterized protein n=1 Tax=Frigoriflavimonas asaccharolytica TaxID=2735899 RepID=A0A8J8G6B6_9FLAO|nr:hypothetical protein [Frigoriflavimonas asaccharolytica]NRS91821.1 hypothetical protein [Frigoriflavimonas asaccharolytica]